MSNNLKIITKSRTLAGNLAKFYTYHWNDLIIFQKLILSKKKIPDCKLIYKKFGLKLYVQEFAFKQKTYYEINKIMFSKLNKLAKNKI